MYELSRLQFNGYKPVALEKKLIAEAFPGLNQFTNCWTGFALIKLTKYLRTELELLLRKMDQSRAFNRIYNCGRKWSPEGLGLE